eukprot:Awhi_evm1s15309
MSLNSIVGSSNSMKNISSNPLLGPSDAEDDEGFAVDMADGFTSSNFDLSENINSNDQRKGLNADKYLLGDMMKGDDMSFDE